MTAVLAVVVVVFAYFAVVVVAAVITAASAPELSAGQRLTIRNREMIANGQHPATRLPLAGNGETCGTCAHHHALSSYRDKCDAHRLGQSASAHSDIRVSWPACTQWKAQP